MFQYVVSTCNTLTHPANFIGIVIVKLKTKLEYVGHVGQVF